MLYTIITLLLCTCTWINSVEAQENTSASNDERSGFIDRDKDGINDRFRDANGDGLNDVDRTPYPHHFDFRDANGDGLNDFFRDADGDGVNDVQGRYIDADGDGYIDNIIDQNKDGKNDITGEEYDRRGLRGWRFGRIFEERRHRLKNYVDRNGDGMHDGLERLSRRLRSSDRNLDFFLDEDGDGIDDTRMLRGRPAPFNHPFLDKRGPMRRPMPPRQRQPPSEQGRKPQGGKK